MFSFFKRFLPKFRRLQWKLTFSYILITAVSLLVAIIVAIMVLIQFVIAQYPQNTSTALLAGVPLVMHDLQRGRHDYLTNDLWMIDDNLQAGYIDPNTGVSAVIPTQEGYTIATDARGLVLASTDTEAMPEGSLLSTKLSSDGMDLVREVINSHGNNKPIISIGRKQVLYAAVPLFNHQKQLIGILLTSQMLPNYGQVIVALFPLLWPTLVLIIFVVGIVGTLFGSFMSRWLVRRFTKVTRATENWSQGDFSSIIADRSGDELGVMTRQLNSMAGKLERLLSERQNIAVLDERHRMARDLHDSLKQQLFASIMQVWSAQALLDSDTAAVKERLGAIEQLLGQAQQELSTLIHRLRPIALVGKPFTEVLRDYCEQWAHQHNITLNLDIAEVDLSLKVDEALLRITQESLSNIARHSDASVVEVQLINQQEQVFLNITDNGRGFDPERVSNQGIGLQSMRERMELLQGTLSIVSKRGDGTRISAAYTKGNSSRLQESITLL